MEPKKYYQIVRGAPDAETAGAWFFQRWGYHAAEILPSDEVYYAGPLRPEDVGNVEGPLGEQVWPAECSPAKCA